MEFIINNEDKFGDALDGIKEEQSKIKHLTNLDMQNLSHFRRGFDKQQRLCSVVLEVSPYCSLFQFFSLILRRFIFSLST